jgi:hypothetical protein
MSADYQPYLRTLRRIPDDIILSMATRPISVEEAFECVCAWAAQEIVADERNITPKKHMGISITGTLYDRCGGTPAEWNAINHAHLYPGEPELLERAFVERVLEACANA